MMSNPREYNAGKRSIALAIDKDKSSQITLKWALDHIVSKHETLKLVHVKERTSSSTHHIPKVWKDDSSMDQKLDNDTLDLLLPFRCFCRRRQVQCEGIILEDLDVAKALIEYVCQQAVDTLLLGSTSRNGLSRLFRTTDIASNVLKWAPDFCTIYIISKGKINSIRTATRPAPSLNIGEGLPLAQTSLKEETFHDKAYDIWDDEMPEVDTDSLMTCSERQSTDSNFLHFYGKLEGEITSCRESLSPRKSNTLIEDAYEDEMRRMKAELKQTTEMYHVACREALAAKQKVSELEEWKRKNERRLQEAYLVEQNALAIGATESVQKPVEIEVQKRMDVEVKGLWESQERQKV